MKNGFATLITSDDLHVQKLHGVFLRKLAVGTQKKKSHTFTIALSVLIGIYLQ